MDGRFRLIEPALGIVVILVVVVPVKLEAEAGAGAGDDTKMPVGGEPSHPC